MGPHPADSRPVFTIKTPPGHDKPTVGAMGQYRHDREKYTCCCGFLRIKIAAWIIFGLEVLKLIWDIYYYLSFNKSDEEYSAVGYFDLGNLLFDTFALTMLLAGLIAQKGNFLIPFLIYKVLEIIYVGASILFVIIYNVFSDDEAETTTTATTKGSTVSSTPKGTDDDDFTLNLAVIIALVMMALVAVLAFVAIYVIFKCRSYFNDLAKHNAQQTNNIHPLNYSTYGYRTQ